VPTSQTRSEGVMWKITIEQITLEVCRRISHRYILEGSFGERESRSLDDIASFGLGAHELAFVTRPARA
jgi:hypothetical protein